MCRHRMPSMTLGERVVTQSDSELAVSAVTRDTFFMVVHLHSHPPTSILLVRRPLRPDCRGNLLLDRAVDVVLVPLGRGRQLGRQSMFAPCRGWKIDFIGDMWHMSMPVSAPVSGSGDPERARAGTQVTLSVLCEEYPASQLPQL